MHKNRSVCRNAGMNAQRRQVRCVHSQSMCLACLAQIPQGSGWTHPCWTVMARGDQRGSPWRSSVSQTAAHLYRPGGLSTWHSMDRGTHGGEKKGLQLLKWIWRWTYLCGVCVFAYVWRMSQPSGIWAGLTASLALGVGVLDCGRQTHTETDALLALSPVSL